MIRFVDIGSQITEESTDFAWYDTVQGRFLEFGGTQVWEDWLEFEGFFDGEPELLARLRPLYPRVDVGRVGVLNDLTAGTRQFKWYGSKSGLAEISLVFLKNARHGIFDLLGKETPAELVPGDKFMFGSFVLKVVHRSVLDTIIVRRSHRLSSEEAASLSEIVVTIMGDEGNRRFSFEWRGDSDIVAFSPELMDEAKAGVFNLLGKSSAVELEPGDRFWFGPFLLSVVGFFDDGAVLARRTSSVAA